MIRPLALVGVLLGALGCAPALDWRTVPLESVQVMLPCKPDRGSRTLVLGSQAVELQMVGCAVSGALFAASRVQAADPQQARALLEPWRSAALAALRADPQAAQTEMLAPPGGTAPAAESLLALRAQGLAPGGAALQAKLWWFVRGSTLYHLALYAPALGETLTEPFFQQARLQ